jgi:hypothetical protein
MKKISPIFVILGLFFIVSSFSGCIEEGFDLSDPLGLGFPTEFYLIAIVIIAGIVIILTIISDDEDKDSKSVIVQIPNQQQPKVSDKEPKSDRRCPECVRIMPEDSKFCPYCGKDFKSQSDDVKKKDVAKEEQEKEEKDKDTKKTPKYCTECGVKVGEDHKYCKKCGTKIEKE